MIMKKVQLDGCSLINGRFGAPRGLRFSGRVLAAISLMAGMLVSAAVGERVTMERLLEEMVDLDGLAAFPDPAFRCLQSSSYDRASKSPEVEWFANGDRGHYLRVEENDGRREFVMLDAEGPGAVVRIWSANPAGNLRVYIDGAKEAVLVAPMTDLLGGRVPGLPRPIAGEYSKGWNLYLPIPYARHCKITSDEGDFYYHVNYRHYGNGVELESFSGRSLEEHAGRLEQLAQELDSPRVAGGRSAGVDSDFRFELGPGDTSEQTLWGPSVITGAVLSPAAEDLEAALRGVVLGITFDGEKTVETPLGDFFGSAPGINPFEALPVGMSESGEMYSNWRMPFGQRADIQLVNYTRSTVKLRGSVYTKPYAWTDSSMHFHAKWRAEFDVPSRPMIDWNYLSATGQGVFVGAAFAIDNPVRDWWGEGDEKIYVDGEDFPSHFGTGTEDYYGYAWCWSGLFSHAYHAQPRCTGPGNYGRTSVNRFHILDRIPFRKDFRFDMELWHWNEKCLVNMAVVAYWYARPGATDAFPVVTASEAVVRPMPEYVVPRVAGAIEGEAMEIERVVGLAEPQDWGDLSAGRHLWWHAGMKPGDELVVCFEAPAQGRFQVLGHFLTAKDYGIHQLAVNGKPAGGPRDFYAPDVKPTGEVDLGVFELNKGLNRLSVTTVGANPKAVKAYMFGLDYLRLRPVD
ncbi:MAG: hypothetical protein RI897_376 [Verrucomicrobiota bacterium]|jgi:hypothetical protein